MNKKYHLIHLIHSLRQGFFFSFAKRYDISLDSSSIHIVYVDHMFDDQHITIFRTSALAYRVYYDGKLYRRRNVVDTIALLDWIVDDISKRCSYYSVITLAELKDLSKFDCSRRLELRSLLHKQK